MAQETGRPIRRSAGCVVYRYDSSNHLLILLIHDQYGCWTLPKGHLKKREREEQAATREVLEETGLTGELGPLVARIAYVVTHKGEQRDKEVAFFLMHTASSTAMPQAEEGISAAEWFPPETALARIGYPQVCDVLDRALQMLAASYGRRDTSNDG